MRCGPQLLLRLELETVVAPVFSWGRKGRDWELRGLCDQGKCLAKSPLGHLGADGFQCFLGENEGMGVLVGWGYTFSQLQGKGQ